MPPAPPRMLDATRPLGAAFAARGVTTWEDAVRHVHALPYGRPDTPALDAPLAAGRGTCSSKHALLAAVAAESGLAADLVLGLFLMDATTHPAVGPTLAAAGLTAVPEAHCYLRVDGAPLDVTFPGVHEPPPAMLVETLVAPAALSTTKVAWHRTLLAEWALAQGLDPEAVWATRETCIGVLAAATAPGAPPA